MEIFFKLGIIFEIIFGKVHLVFPPHNQNLHGIVSAYFPVISISLATPNFTQF